MVDRRCQRLGARAVETQAAAPARFPLPESRHDAASRGSVGGEELAGIEDAVGIEARAYAAHQGNLGGTARARQILALDQADAVLGRNAATVAAQRRRQQARRLAAQVTECLASHVFGWKQVDVQVAVADMPEPDHLELR